MLSPFRPYLLDLLALRYPQAQPKIHRLLHCATVLMAFKMPQARRPAHSVMLVAIIAYFVMRDRTSR